MKDIEMFIRCLNTLLFSWGSDTPTEAIWTLNELLDWFEIEYGFPIHGRFLECNENGYEEQDYEKIFDDLRSISKMVNDVHNV